MKRFRIVAGVALGGVVLFVSGIFSSGPVDIANTASGALLPETAHTGALPGEVQESVKEGEGRTNWTVQAPSAHEPHEAGPVDPWKPRPTIPPPGAIEHSGPWSRGPFESIQVNVDENGNNILGDAANEPSIAIDPTNPNNIVIGWRQFDSVESNFRQAGYAYSHDGGQSWTFPGVLERERFRSDPVVEVDANGNFYFYSLTGNFLCDMFKSTNGGEAWIGPIEAFGGDKSWMAIDRTGGIGRGNIYCAWDHVGCCDDDVFTRSVDVGVTYSYPVPISGFPLWGVTTVGVDGTVFVGGLSYLDQRFLVVARSSSAQDPNRDPAFDSVTAVDLDGWLGWGGRDGPNPGGLVGQLWVATDHSDRKSRGNVYVLASLGPRSGSDPLELMFSRSVDGGRTFSRGRRVTDDQPSPHHWQWFGTMAVAPNGRIDAVWNDTRNTDDAAWSETFYAYSSDAGESWSKNIPISQEWNSHIGWPNQDKIGDYYDMVSDDNAANLAYAATFNGEQDVYYLAIMPDCNDNGQHDGNDIMEGTSRDANGNGIPDECEFRCMRDPVWLCDGDVDGDGQVNPVDSGLVQAAFGSADEQDLCNYDLDCDGQINPVDSGIVQSLLGTCEAPRSVCP